jgi:prepilin-type N-terminal cleavage/methylation domain-containing protein
MHVRTRAAPPRTDGPACGPARGRHGFTLLEVAISIGVMTIALAMFSSVIASSARIGTEKRQSSVAAHAARSLLEELRSEPFRECWARYNDDPADDPGGAGTAPGRFFAVDGLDPLPGDADGFVGEIVLPGWNGALREDAQDDLLGLPRDLDGDSIVDESDHAGDYAILPVMVRVEWQAPLGARRVEMYTMLVDLGGG